MEKIKLDIQKFAQTLLNNKKSTASSPYAYYTVECTSISNRTDTTVDVTIKVTSKLASSSSYFGTGSTYGLTGTIYFGGVTKTLTLKSTSASWSGTTAHTKSGTFTIDCPAASTSLTNIYFKVDRTGSKAGTTDTSAGCWLSKTSCSNITGIAQRATEPVFTVAPSITNLTETTATLNLGTATATGEVYYQYKIGSNSYSGNVTGAQSLTGLTAGQTYSYSVKAINKINSSLTKEATGSFKTYTYPSVVTEAPGSLSLDSSTKSFTLTFKNDLSKTITVTAKVGNVSVIANNKESLTTSSTSCAVTIDVDKVYQQFNSGGSCTLTVKATATNLNYSGNVTLNANLNYAGPTLDISKMKWQPISTVTGITTTSMIKSKSYLQIKRESGLATANKSASITSIKFKLNNGGGPDLEISGSGWTSWSNYNGTTTYALTGNQTATVTITDSRGLTKSNTVTIPFLDWTSPSLTVIAARNGYSTDVIFTFSASCSLAAYGNAIQTAYLSTSSSPSTAVQLSNNKYTIHDIAVEDTPTYYAKVIDKLGGTSSVVTIKVPKAEPTMFIDSYYNGVGINCFPTGSGLYTGAHVYIGDNKVGNLYVGSTSDTTREHQIQCRSGAGILYLYSQASTTGSRGLYVPAHGTATSGKAVISIDTNNNATFNGNASTATNTSKVADTVTNPSSWTNYKLPFMEDNSNQYKDIRSNDGIKYSSQQGTTSAVGSAVLRLGNNVLNTTNGNKRGIIYLYGTKAALTEINTNVDSTNRTVSFPDKSGTIAMTSDIDAKFPVGSVYITNTNSNPGSYLPGGISGWTLIDKEFAPFCVTGSTDGTYFTKNTTYIDTMTLSFTIAGHSIDFSGSFKLKHVLDDTDDDPFGSFNLSSFVSNFRNDRYVSGWTDGGNCIDMLKVTSAGALTSVDIVGANSVAVGQTVGVTIHFNFQMSDMVDAKCNKFYWKRTA